MTKVAEKEPTPQTTDTNVLPILPLRGTIVYPFLVTPLMIQQADQTKLVDDASTFPPPPSRG
jgi:ATP-dependent Lon protease